VELVTFCNANSSQAGQWIQAPHRVQEALSHTLALPLGSASGVWWSAGISLDADHQTLQEAFRRSNTQRYAISRNSI
jgi:hypothetical protein